MEPRTVKYPLLHPRVSDEVRVLSWNVSYGDSADHADEVTAALQSFDCDILCLSEVVSPALQETIHALGYGGVYVEANYRRLLRPIYGGLVLFSRFAVEDLRIVETMTDGLMFVRRYYIEARLRICEGFSITVGMTHHTLPFETRYMCACEALHREVSEHTERFLFVGDLNTPLWFPVGVVRKLRKRFVHLGPPLCEGSFRSKRWIRYVYPPVRLDYAFGTSDLKVIEARFGDFGPSDHRPILIRLKTKD